MIFYKKRKLAVDRENGRPGEFAETMVVRNSNKNFKRLLAESGNVKAESGIPVKMLPEPRLLPSEQSDIGKVVDIFCVLLVLMFSGNPGFINLCGGITAALLILPWPLLAVMLWRRRTPFSQGLWVVAAFALLELWHAATVSSVSSSLGMIIRVIDAYLLVRAVGDRVVPCFIKIMVCLSVLGIILFLIQLNGWVDPWLSDCYWLHEITGGNNERYYFLIHTYFPGYHRNAGCFWEPGALSGYCSAALIMLVAGCRGGKLLRQLPSAIILVLGIVSTMSTTGYMVLAAIMGYWFLQHISLRNAVVFLPLFALFAYAAVWSFSHFDFLEEKITTQYNYVVEERYGWQINRFGSFLHDLDYWKERPFLGYGSDVAARYNTLLESEIEEIALAKGNGFSEFLVRNGLAGMMLFCAGIFFLSTRILQTKWPFALGIVLIFAMILQGEMFLNYPFFIVLMLLGYGNRRRADAVPV